MYLNCHSHFSLCHGVMSVEELAEEALQSALDKIDEISEEDFRDAKSIIELLKENLTLWKEEEGGQPIEDL